MNIMDRIKNTGIAEHTFVNMLVYGASGSGKTRLIASALPKEEHEKILILSAEGGLLSLMDFSIPHIKISNFEELQEAYQFIHRGDHGFTWLCIDSISEIAELCLEQQKGIHGDSANGWATYGGMAEAMIGLLKGLRDLPINVYLSAQMTREKDGQGALIYGPEMPGNKLSGKLPFLFDEVFRLHSVSSEDGKSVTRKLQTFKDTKSEAKDRSGKLAPWEDPNLLAITAKILKKA